MLNRSKENIFPSKDLPLISINKPDKGISLFILQASTRLKFAMAECPFKRKFKKENSEDLKRKFQKSCTENSRGKFSILPIAFISVT